MEVTHHIVLSMLFWDKDKVAIIFGVYALGTGNYSGGQQASQGCDQEQFLIQELYQHLDIAGMITIQWNGMGW